MENEKKSFKDRFVAGCKKNKDVVIGIAVGVGTALGIGGIVGLVRHSGSMAVVVDEETDRVYSAPFDDDGYYEADIEASETENEE